MHIPDAVLDDPKVIVATAATGSWPRT